MKIVILGITGMLGHKMLQTLGQLTKDIVGFAYEDVRIPPFEKVSIYNETEVITGVDVSKFDVLNEHLRGLKPDFIINCVGIVKQRDTSSSYIPSILLNSLLPHQLASSAATWGGRVVHFSTDCVFDGKDGNYSEQDFSNATDLYGRSKYLGEVQTENALSLRTSIIGRELANHRSLLDWFLSQKGKTVNGFKNVIYSGVTTNQISKVVKMIIEQYPNLSGLYQVVADPISKFDLLTMIRDGYDLDIEIIPEEDTFSDRSMQGHKLKNKIGYVSPAWHKLIKELVLDPTPYSEWGIDL